MSKNNKIGKMGEKLAQVYLEKQNYNIKMMNFFTPLGEIDIIAEKNDVLFFVEVKTRKNSRFGTGLEAITPRKLQKIQKCAEIYLADTEWSGVVHLMFLAIEYRSENDFSVECIIE